MTHTSLDAGDGLPTTQLSESARAAGYAIAAAVVVLFAFYGTYFVYTLVALAPEQAALTATQTDSAGLYPWFLNIWQTLAGDSLVAARLLSLLATVLAIVVAFNATRDLTGDPVMAAFLILSFVLYPPLVATLTLATPHALFVLVAMLVLPAMKSKHAVRGFTLAGLSALVGAMLHPMGAVVMPLWILVCGMVLNRRMTHVLMTAMGVAVVAVALRSSVVAVPGVDPNVSGGGHDTVLKAILIPYAMVLVGAALSAIAVLAVSTRQALGVRTLLGLLLGLTAAALIVVVDLAAGENVGAWVTQAGILFPLVFLAPWPLVYWVRRVMPQVKSIIAWIAFPVIMYSCFWVVLGPVDPGRFPYSHRQSSSHFDASVP